jgi:molybdate transport system substrate-binding protein
MATSQLLQALCAKWLASTGKEVELQSVGGVDASKRIEAGESFDVAVLASETIDRLAAAGRVEFVAPFTISEVGIAAKIGTKPSISTRAQLIEAMKASRAIGYSSGPSGKALLTKLAEWNALDALKDRLKQAPPGIAVGILIADGSVDFGFQQLSELIHCEGISLLGTMPAGDEISTVFSAAHCKSGDQSAAGAADEFIAYICSPESAELIDREGMSPAFIQKQ